MQSTKLLNGVTRVLKVKVIPLPWAKDTHISKFKLVFLRNLWVIWNQISYESSWEKGWKFILITLVTWPRWPPWPFMLKTLWKSSSPEPPEDCLETWYVALGTWGPSEFVQIMTLGWPWPILFQGQIWSLRLFNGQKWKMWIFFFFLNYCIVWAQNW